MKYEKPPLTFEEQADLLLSRGMKGDRATMVDRLAVVNYYRLSGYWHPFRNPDSTFRPNTTFDAVWQRYAFDRHLRLLVMDAVERMFTVLTICNYCLDRIAPQSHWSARWRELLAKYPFIPRGSMGIPTDWQDCPIWTKPKEPDNG